jgi:hypothetical protein
MNRKSKNKSKRGQRKNRRSRSAPTSVPGGTAHSDLRSRTPLFPTRFRKILSYSEAGLAIAGTAGLAGNYFLSANGLYDPNVSGVGHQPLGFDEMMLLYNHYTVVRSKITVHFINSSAAGVYSSCGLYLSPDTTSITVPSRLIENGLISWANLMPINTFGCMKTISLGCDIASYYGRNKNMRSLCDDTDLYGTAAANPNDQVYFAVLVFDPTLANNVSVAFVVEIEYEAIFWEPRKLTQS